MMGAICCGPSFTDRVPQGQPGKGDCGHSNDPYFDFLMTTRGLMAATQCAEVAKVWRSKIFNYLRCEKLSVFPPGELLYDQNSKGEDLNSMKATKLFLTALTLGAFPSETPPARFWLLSFSGPVVLT
jgi:hypothetical protein